MPLHCTQVAAVGVQEGQACNYLLENVPGFFLFTSVVCDDNIPVLYVFCMYAHNVHIHKQTRPFNPTTIPLFWQRETFLSNGTEDLINHALWMFSGLDPTAIGCIVQTCNTTLAKMYCATNVSDTVQEMAPNTFLPAVPQGRYKGGDGDDQPVATIPRSTTLLQEHARPRCFV